MNNSTSTIIKETPGIIILTPLLQEALQFGAAIDWRTYVSSRAGDSPLSPGFITFIVNEDKANIPHLHCVTPDKLNWVLMVAEESQQVEKFTDYLTRLENKRVLVENLIDASLAKIIRPSDASRYFPAGRKRIKGKIFKRLGRWFNCPGYLLSLTFGS